jgi:hypothetical protein
MGDRIAVLGIEPDANGEGKRVPRPSTATPDLPATFAEAEEAEIIATLERWYRRIADKLTAEFAHEKTRDDIVRQLERGEGASLPLDYIVAMAEADHPVADHALRTCIRAAIDADRFNDLPLQVRNYARRALDPNRAPIPSTYPSNRAQVVNNRSRDIAIAFLIDQIVRRWPHVPKLYSSKTRRSAACLVALVFTRYGVSIKEQRVRQIYNERPTLSRRLAEFLIADLPFE